MSDLIKFLSGPDTTAQHTQALDENNKPQAYVPLQPGQVLFGIGSDKGKLVGSIYYDYKDASGDVYRIAMGNGIEGGHGIIDTLAASDNEKHVSIPTVAQSKVVIPLPNKIFEDILSAKEIFSIKKIYDATNANYSNEEGKIGHSYLYGNGLHFINPFSTLQDSWIRNIGVQGSAEAELELAMRDNASSEYKYDQIVARQYKADGATIVADTKDGKTTKREVIILGKSGESNFPGPVTSQRGFIGDINGNATSANKAQKDWEDQNIQDTYVARVLKTQNTGTVYELTTYNGHYKTLGAKKSKIDTISIGGANTTTAGLVTTGAQTWTGNKTFNDSSVVTIQKASGFNYSGIETGEEDATRPIWFAHSSKNGTPVINAAKFTYNPKTETLTVKYLAGTASAAGSANRDGVGNVINTTYLKLAGGTMTGAIKFTSQDSCFNDKNILFTSGVRIGGNTSGAVGIYADAIYLRPNSKSTADTTQGVSISANKVEPAANNKISLGTSSAVWSDVYATNFHGRFKGTADRAETAGTADSVAHALNINRKSYNGSSTVTVGDTIYYITANKSDATAGTWTGTDTRISSYYDGLTIIFVPKVAGASTTTLNLNGLGAKTIYWNNTSKLTTHFAAGTPIMLTYVGGYWRRADYDSDANTQIRVYRQLTTNTSYNAEYPILVSRTQASGIGTAGTNDSYTQVYGVMNNDTTKIPTINIHTGVIKAVTFDGIATHAIYDNDSSETNVAIHNKYLKRSGGTMTGNITFSKDNIIQWSRNTDFAKIGFKNDSDGDTDSYMYFHMGDNGNEYFKFRITSGNTVADVLNIKNGAATFNGTVTATKFIGALQGTATYASKAQGDSQTIRSKYVSSVVKKSGSNYIFTVTKGDGTTNDVDLHFAASASCGGDALSALTMGQGNDQNATLDANDLIINNARSKKTFYATNTDKMANRPSGTHWGYLDVGSYGTGHTTQMFINGANADTYVRVRNNTWGAWKQFAFTDGKIKNAEFADKAKGDSTSIRATYIHKIKQVTSNGTTFTFRGEYGDGSNANDLITIPNASASLAGLITTGAQTIAGNKTFSDVLQNKRAFYNVATIDVTDTFDEFIIKTKLPFANGNEMPHIHIRGYAYGDGATVDFNVVFYIYDGAFCGYSYTTTGGWSPSKVYISTYTNNGSTYVALSFTGSIYFPKLAVDLLDIWSGTTRSDYGQGWTVALNKSASGTAIPQSNIKEVGRAKLATSISGNATTATYTTQLLGVNGSNTPYDAIESNLIRAVWNVKGDNRWYLKAGTYNCRVNYADNADTLDGYHESSFLRYRDAVKGSGGTSHSNSLWSQIGIRQYHNILPDAMADNATYAWGAVVSLPGTDSRLDIWYNHQTSSYGDGLRYRTGWDNDKRAWATILDSLNYGAIADGRYVKKSGDTMTGNLTAPSVYTSNWFRSTGSTGWYNETYGGGWYMTDSNFIRNFNSKALSVNINSNNAWGIGTHRLAAVFKGNDHVSILLSTNTLGYGLCVNNNGNWYWGKRTTSSETSASGDSYVLYGNTSHISPDSTNAMDLGLRNHRWRSCHIYRDFNIYGNESTGDESHIRFNASDNTQRAIITFNGNVDNTFKSNTHLKIATSYGDIRLAPANGNVNIGDGNCSLTWRKADNGGVTGGLESGVYFSTPGRESVVFANMYAHTGWIFVNGIRPSNKTAWNTLGVTPAVQIHHNALYINRPVRNADTADYNLYVNGSGYINGRLDACNRSNSASYMESAIQIRERGFGGAQDDTWATAPRLSWHWAGRVQTQIGLGGNGELYLSKNNFANAYKLVYETGTWGININGNAATATKLATARTISLTGSVTGSGTFDGSGNLSISTVTNHVHHFLSYGSMLTSDSAINSFHKADVFQAALWSGTSSPGCSNGIILDMGWASATYGAQIAIDDDPTYFIALRQRDGNGWKAWRRIPMGDGTGAYGTWGISINGNAHTVDGYHADAFVKKAGDTMTGPLTFANGTCNVVGDDCGMGDINSAGTLAFQGKNGTTNLWLVKYGEAWNTSANHATISYDGTKVSCDKPFYGAVWNDYAEYRKTHHEIKPGRCVIEVGDGSLTLAFDRLQPGANIVSDTFGFAIGETDKTQTPLAVSGRVLAYPYEDRYSYEPGDAVCSGPNGTVSKMTREEIREYPDRIIGTVSEIPDYEEWGTGKVKVNGRIWIKVK